MKKKLVFLFLLFLISSAYFLININISHSYSSNYSRKDLQDMVVSTALSYYYNKNYSDYEQKSMDKSNTISWRSLRYSPEMVSRINNYMIDCSGFVSIAYLYSLGYDFSDYRNNISSYYYHNGVKYYFKDSYETYQNGYYITGKNLSTYLYSDSAENYFKSLELDGKIKLGKEYNNNNNKNSEFAYFYKVDIKDSTNNVNEESEITEEEFNLETNNCNTVMYNESCEKQQNIKNNIINQLQPGDIFVYRRYDKNKNAYNGHAILYVGDIFNKNEHGFIHSTGSDYNFESDPITINEDTYSVRYDTWDNLFYNQLFKNDLNNKIMSYSFTIIRPINLYCNNNECNFSKNDVKSIRYKNEFSKYFENTIARTELSRLRVEQYQFSGEDIINDYKKTKTKNNSLNIGDLINYRVGLTNKSYFNYCESGSYTTEEKCINSGNKWKETNADKTYKVKVVGKIPENTKFVSCNKNCEFNSNDNTVTWSNIVLSSKKNAATNVFTYQVEILDGERVTNEGMKIITADNNTLMLGEMSVNVNPTINSNKDIKYLNNIVEELKNKNVKYNTDFDFIKDIYYKTFNVDLNNLNFDNIKNSIFKNDLITSERYNKRISSEIDKLSEEMKLINKMLVPGIYGGRLLKNDDNLDRSHILIKHNNEGALEVGDILITYDLTSGKNNAWLFYGYDNNLEMIFLTYDNNIKEYSLKNSAVLGKSGWRIFKEIYSKDLFVVLRPTSVYGTTVTYDYNNKNIKNDLFIAYKNYKNLEIPINNEIKITFIVNGKEIKSIKSNGNFLGWYSDKNQTKKIDNNSLLSSEKNHTLYAKYDFEKIKLPYYEENGKLLKGWYDDIELKNIVGSPNDELIFEKDIVLYGKIESTKGKVSYNSNGGTGTMNDQNFTLDTQFKLNKNTFTKTDYRFSGWNTKADGSGTSYTDEEEVTFDKNIILYAIWEDSIPYTINKYSVDETNKYISKIMVNTEVNNFTSNIILGYGYGIDVDTKTINNKQLLYTGGKTRITKGLDLYREYTNIVIGDINGDGAINSADLLKIRQHLLGTNILSGAYFLSSDINYDNTINSADLLRVRQHLLGTKPIE